MTCSVWESDLDDYLDTPSYEETKDLCLACSYRQGVIRTIIKGIVKAIGKLIDFFLITIIKNVVCFISSIIIAIFNLLTAPIRWLCRFKKGLANCLKDYPLLNCIVNIILFIPKTLFIIFHRLFCFFKWLLIRVPVYLFKKVTENILEIVGCIPLIGCWLKEQGIWMLLLIALILFILAALLFKFTIGLSITTAITIFLGLLILLTWIVPVLQFILSIPTLIGITVISLIPIVGPIISFFIILIVFILLLFVAYWTIIVDFILGLLILLAWIFWGATGI